MLILFKWTLLERSLISLLRSLVIKSLIDNIFVERLGFIYNDCGSASRLQPLYNSQMRSQESSLQKKIYALVGHRPTAIKETKWQLLQDPHVSFYFSQLEKRNCFLNIYRCKYTQWFMGKVYHMYYLIGIAFGLFKLWNFKVIDLSYSHSELLKYLWIS